MYHSVVGVWHYWANLDVSDVDFDISERNKRNFGFRFIPDLLKYFNLCGEIVTSRQRWWNSNLVVQNTSDLNFEINKRKRC